MHRRNFTLGLALTPLLSSIVHAADSVIAGTDYTQLSTPIPVSVPGKIEVIEFFGYWCPHCNAFESKIEPWIQALPSDVNFRRIPVAWSAQHIPYQKLYFALEIMGAKGDIHSKAFKAFHEQGQRLENTDGINRFAAAINVDKAKLTEAINSFTIANKINLATQQAKTYQIEGVPTLIVNGKFATSPETAKGEEKALKVVDALIQKERSKR